jgi:hypothetical protein
MNASVAADCEEVGGLGAGGEDLGAAVSPGPFGVGWAEASETAIRAIRRPEASVSMWPASASKARPLVHRADDLGDQDGGGERDREFRAVGVRGGR